MKRHSLSTQEYVRAAGVGIGVSILTAAFMAASLMTGLSPLPKSLGQAFAETILGRQLPLPVGLLFHTVWLTAFSVVYVGLFRDALTFLRALSLGIVLWVVVLLFFFPTVGWGMLGLAVSPKVIVGSAVPHLLFAVFLWSLSALAFRRASSPAS